MKKNGGNNEESKEHSFENAGFINNLIGEDFVNHNPRRDIFNVTFTFPKAAKDDINQYIKKNGKDHLVDLIVGEVEKCRNAEAK